MTERPETIKADWLTVPSLQAVFAALTAAGHTTRAVGGAVRDALRGDQTRVLATDVDLATTATPNETIAAAAAGGLKTIPTGIAHGTVTVLSGTSAYEVTTLRADVTTDGRHAKVAFSTDWAEDAARRDFTINALYCDADGRLFDPLNGYADLREHRLRFIGDADTRIREDYLRVLRYFRFSAQKPDLTLSAEDLAACSRSAHALNQLSAERIQGELWKTLGGAGAWSALQQMCAYGVLAHVLPVAPNLGRLSRLIDLQSNPEVGRALAARNAASVATDQATVLPEPTSRFCALAVSVREDVPRLAKRLRLSNHDKQDLDQLAHFLEQNSDWESVAANWKIARYRLPTHLFASALIHLASRRSPVSGSDLATCLEAAAVWPIPKFPLSGNDLMAAGQKAGPMLGRRLAALETIWVLSNFEMSTSDLLSELSAIDANGLDRDAKSR